MRESRAFGKLKLSQYADITILHKVIAYYKLQEPKKFLAMHVLKIHILKLIL